MSHNDLHITKSDYIMVMRGRKYKLMFKDKCIVSSFSCDDHTAKQMLLLKYNNLFCMDPMGAQEIEQIPVKAI